MPVVTTIVTGEYVYNEGHTEVKQQIAGIICYILVPFSDEKGWQVERAESERGVDHMCYDRCCPLSQRERARVRAFFQELRDPLPLPSPLTTPGMPRTVSLFSQGQTAVEGHA